MNSKDRESATVSNTCPGSNCPRSATYDESPEQGLEGHNV